MVFAGEILDWLLEPDGENPGVRYFALRQLQDRAADDPDVAAARAAVMATGPVPKILAAQETGGYWEKPGPGYSPKYRGTVWQVIQLHLLGADPPMPAWAPPASTSLDTPRPLQVASVPPGAKAGCHHRRGPFTA